MLVADEKENFTHIPAHKRQIVDVSGAGDTVISVLSVGLAWGLPITQVAALANLAGGLVCEYVGVVPVPKEQWIAQARAFGLWPEDVS
jgi:bifunctional ADP-heptose synthase (sugar kinase/adenylyltransferase)